jgi:hypothetical protein
MLLKTKGQRSNRGPIETLALYSLGAWEGSRSCVLVAQSRGFNSPRLHSKIFPACGCSRRRGLSSDVSQGQGWKPAVILALSPGESKSQSDDVPQLQNRVL